MNILWNTDPPPTDTSRMDVTTIFYCAEHLGCLLRDDTIQRDGRSYCRRHGVHVINVTNTPLGHAYRQIVSPKPRK